MIETDDPLKMTSSIATEKARLLNLATVGAILFAFFAWGGWAFFINRDSTSFAGAIRAGLTQGLYSGIMTLYMSFSVYFFWNRTKHLRLKRILPALGTVGHTGFLLVAVHIINQTPNIMKTISIPLMVASGYCLVLTRTFENQKAK